MSLLDAAWEQREDACYKQMFGDIGNGIFPLTMETFEPFELTSVDARWLQLGVFACPPCGERSHWLYVTSGMSNPAEDAAPQPRSGIGTEFIMETEQEAPWAIRVLHTLMAYNLLLATGKMGDYPTFSAGHRVKFGLSSKISAMLFATPVHFPQGFELPSGHVDLVQVVGITGEELQFAQQDANNTLAQRLLEATGGLVTQPERDSVVPA